MFYVGMTRETTREELMLGPACSPLTANTASVPMLRAFFMRPAATGSRAAQFSYVSVLLADGRLN